MEGINIPHTEMTKQLQRFENFGALSEDGLSNYLETVETKAWKEIKMKIQEGSKQCVYIENAQQRSNQNI